MAAAVGSLGFGASAYAAGSGYGSGGVTAPTGTGAYSQVVSVQTVPATGGTLTATVDGAVLEITIPSGEFSVPTQLVFTTGNLTQITTTGVAGTTIAVFGIQFDQGGQKLTGALPRPVTVTVKMASITSSSVVYEQGVSGFSPAPGWTTSSGQASGTITSDPDFAVANPPVPVTTVPGATVPTTGEPFIGMGMMAGGLVVVGGFGFWWSRRRMRTAA